MMPETSATARRGPASLYASLRGRLGIRRIRSDRDLVDLVEKRLPANTIRSLVSSGLSDAEVYQLIVPRRTLAHRLTKHQLLSTEESDKVVRVARITALVEQVFGEGERAWRWIRKPKRQFGGKSPIAMLATEAGARLVEDLLIRIDDGSAA